MVDRSGEDGDRGFRRQRARPEDRGGLRRPPEQARSRDRIARRWYDVEGVDMITDLTTSSVALAVQRTRQAEEEDRHRRRRCDLGAHRRGLHALRFPLGLRHPRARGLDRRRAGEDRRRHLVLHHRGLRLRPRAGERHRRRRQGRGRQGARLGARTPLNSSDFSSFLLAGAELEGEDRRPRQCRARHHQFDQAGGGIRHRQRRPAACRRC